MSEPEIDELRTRWEADPSPTLTLELADAHRRRGEHQLALEVLAAGLETSPDHVAARVAKGRCHLELDQVEDAVAELAPVVIDDPAHLVANRLLAEAHARRGELGRARDRIDLFELLGGGAEEVEALERQLEAAAGSEPVAEPMSEPEPEPDAAPAAAADESGDGDADPFVLLDWIEFDEQRYAAALWAEGIFAPLAERARAAVAVSAPAAPATEAAPTLTLGELYRRQGHRDEAVSIFREILERQPGNVEAARALGEMEKEGGWPLSAEDLLGGGGESGEAATGELLRRYRDRLRAKSKR